MQEAPNNQIDWPTIGTAISSLAAAIVGATAWWKNRSKTEEEKAKKHDPDLAATSDLRSIIDALKSENARLIQENIRLWQRLQEQADRIERLAQRVQGLDGGAENGTSGH